MATSPTSTHFNTKLQRPSGGHSWSFLVLPKKASEILPRRGMTTVTGTINGHPFQATLEPDGKLSHWLKVSEELRTAAGIAAGDAVTLEIRPIDEEPDPEVPEDLQKALDTSPEAQAVWLATTSIARLDWIHWISSAKQAKTRTKRINDACDMLAGGKKRVCCFDQSGYYSKSFSAPEAAD